jgi:hypothetical protein
LGSFLFRELLYHVEEHILKGRVVDRPLKVQMFLRLVEIMFE